VVPSDGAESVEAATEFDAFIDRALDEREKAYGYPVFEHHHLRRMRVGSLALAYRDGGVFPSERTSGVIARAIDVKLQLYITGEIVPGLLNERYYARVNHNPALADSTSVKLVMLSLHQDMITKSRILWDRIMGWIYFIETGSEDIPRTARRSAKRRFFEMCRTTPRWRWMEAYEPTLTDFDDRFRTPEVHKRSVLRALLIKGDDLDGAANELMGLLNHAMNQIWENVESIVGGGGVVSLGSVHVPVDDGNPIYERNPFDQWGWQP
jgi:hypothetical protein